MVKKENDLARMWSRIGIIPAIVGREPVRVNAGSAKRGTARSL